MELADLMMLGEGLMQERWCLPSGHTGEQFNSSTQGQWQLSLPAFATQLSLSLYVSGTSQASVPLPEPRVSAWE